MNMSVCWLILFAILLIVELATMGLTTIWFAGGSLIACVLALFNAPLWLQIFGFLVVSVVLLIFTRPIAVKYFNNNRTRTNVESMIGKEAVVMTDIDNVQGVGQVKVGGMDWSARSLNGEPIAAGNVVEIKEVEGVKVLVEMIEKTPENITEEEKGE